jgi:thioredoxin-like negative regulator of GroEL
MKVKHIGGNNDLQEFNDEFPKHNLVVAGFFATWCGHCKTFKPEWEKFTGEAKKSPLQALVATIPEEYMKGAKCDQTDFQGFPTVRIFKDGKFEDYKGERKANELMKHIKTLVSKSQRGGKKRRRSKRRRTQRKRRKMRKKGRRRYKRKTHKRRVRKRRK